MLSHLGEGERGGQVMNRVNSGSLVGCAAEKTTQFFFFFLSNELN